MFGVGAVLSIARALDIPRTRAGCAGEGAMDRIANGFTLGGGCMWMWNTHEHSFQHHELLSWKPKMRNFDWW